MGVNEGVEEGREGKFRATLPGSFVIPRWVFLSFPFVSSNRANSMLPPLFPPPTPFNPSPLSSRRFLYIRLNKTFNPLSRCYIVRLPTSNPLVFEPPLPPPFALKCREMRLKLHGERVGQEKRKAICFFVEVNAYVGEKRASARWDWPCFPQWNTNWITLEASSVSVSFSLLRIRDQTRSIRRRCC